MPNILALSLKRFRNSETSSSLFIVWYLFCAAKIHLLVEKNKLFFFIFNFLVENVCFGILNGKSKKVQPAFVMYLMSVGSLVLYVCLQKHLRFPSSHLLSLASRQDAWKRWSCCYPRWWIQDTARSYTYTELISNNSSSTSWFPLAQQVLGERISAVMQAHNSCWAAENIGFSGL